MQVKKFEAPTLQEALDTIKRELGPEAIILQTKQNRRGFGLMSKGSVEVTAAVSARSIDKKKEVEKRIPEAYAQKMNQAPANRQADFYENYLEKKVEREKVQLSAAAAQQKRISAVRYADIQDEGEQSKKQERSNPSFSYVSDAPAIPEFKAPANIESAIQNYSNLKEENYSNIQEELNNLKRLVEELRRERNKPEYLESDSPFQATDALQEAYETLLQSGIERRFSVQIMREIGRNLSIEARAENESVLDAVAEQLLKRIDTRSFFPNASLAPGEQAIEAFVGVSGVGKTALLAKLATHAVRSRNEKLGIIRVHLSNDEGVDPIAVFAKALHVPYRSVTNSEEFMVAIQDMSQCGRIFIDTPGVSSKDPQTIRKLQMILRSIPSVRVELVLSATTRDLELHEQGKAFAGLNPNSILVTRLDEAYSFGSIYSISHRLRLPISVFSTGKKVTEQWENASAERLTASILNIL